MAFELTRQRIIIYSIIAVLAVLLIGILIYTQIAGKDTSSGVVRQTSSVGGLTSTEANKPFDTSVLSNPQYLSLDHAPIDAGRLPVPVPAQRGKTNLFGL